MDRPEDPGGDPCVSSGHVLSETAGACRVIDKLNCSPKTVFRLGAGGQHRRGKTGFFLEAFALPVLFGSNPLIQRRALALLPWGQAPRRRKDESFLLKPLWHVGNR